MGQHLLFTHELLQEFWNLSCDTRVTHKAWLRSKIRGWKDNVLKAAQAQWHVACDIRSILQRPSLVDRMHDVLYDYLELLDIDYAPLFACQCDQPVHTKDYLVGIYDNACKWSVLCQHLICAACCLGVFRLHNNPSACESIPIRAGLNTCCCDFLPWLDNTSLSSTACMLLVCSCLVSCVRLPLCTSRMFGGCCSVLPLTLKQG